MYYKTKTVHNYLDGDDNIICSIRRANVENMQKDLKGVPYSIEEYVSLFNTIGKRYKSWDSDCA